ncbi:MAG TPA: hypothetical protein VME19_05780 [Streptosporangiaceae bacterium]|nr:hypothetical protein [Streptosporangiaceae bacterium]
MTEPPPAGPKPPAGPLGADVAVTHIRCFPRDPDGHLVELSQSVTS